MSAVPEFLANAAGSLGPNLEIIRVDRDSSHPCSFKFWMVPRITDESETPEALARAAHEIQADGGFTVTVEWDEESGSLTMAILSSLGNANIPYGQLVAAANDWNNQTNAASHVAVAKVGRIRVVFRKISFLLLAGMLTDPQYRPGIETFFFANLYRLIQESLNYRYILGEERQHSTH